MKVIISEELVAASINPSQILLFHQLIAIATQGSQHFLFFETDNAIELAVQGYAQNLQPLYKKFFLDSYREAATYPSERAAIKIDLVGSSQWDIPIPVVTLNDALKVLTEKLVILLENAENDWYFLLGIMNSRDRARMCDYVAKGWAEPGHGGGDTLGMIMDNRIQHHWKALRTFVIFDSDRLHPDEFDENWTPVRQGQQPSSCNAYEWEVTAKQFLANRYWMLSRRFIESYMPQNELTLATAAKPCQDAIAALFSMSNEQRWHYNMKAGFIKDGSRHDIERCKNLYDNLTPEKKQILANGFGRTLAKHYKNSITSQFTWDAEALAEANSVLPKLLNML
ncbi:hypothetical protein H8L32_11260 [Undibacterium sp. CY18W]|uniref:Uncharacterized protein n=1 Tax=Undibacterium hunanense TaxID=2762292 RepID=A0ABR6ZQ90_9BURK|nr:hypothetical protein [Undibacterium hunanense]MBC3918056.1 hypothetical protein [Undibacterium hunanense]